MTSLSDMHFVPSSWSVSLSNEIQTVSKYGTRWDIVEESIAWVTTRGSEMKSSTFPAVCLNYDENYCFRFIAFGAGAGANVFLRFALAHPERVECMALLNPTVRRAGWVEWGYLKLAVRYLNSGVVNR